MAKTGSKGAKIGRNKASCESYRREDRQAKNATARQVRHLHTLERFKARRIRLGLEPAAAPVGVA